MGNCLSTCTKSPETAVQDQVVELQPVQSATPLTVLNAGNQVFGGNKVRDLVQQELQALQEQISHSQAVLARLKFRFNDEPLLSSEPEKDTTHRTTQTSNPDTLPRSLECVAVTVEKDWQQVTASCPAIVSTAVQTDDETSKSNGTSGDYFLPPISPLDSQASEPPSPRDLDEVSSKPFEPRPLTHIDLDIYRSCRKLSVLPEEEGVPDEISPPTAGSRLAPTHCPHQAHSFESYLLPTSSVGSVRRQLSDPTPSPEIHPASRRSSRSTCRPLQLQPEVFRFPEVKTSSPEKEIPKSPPLVKFQNPLEQIKETDHYLPRITSPTYNILQDTVSQLITMSTETLDTQMESSQDKKESLTIPGYNNFTPDGSTPFKTPPDTSLISTPGFFTPQEFSDKKLLDSTSSSCFQSPLSASPGTNGFMLNGNKSTSNSSQSFKTPPMDQLSDRTSYQSSYSTPLFLSPLPKKRSTNKINENAFTEVPDLKSLRTNGQLFVKPLPQEFDPNRPMLSILFDEPKVQYDNNVEVEQTSFISFTSLPIQQAPASVHTPPTSEQVPSEALLSPGTEGLARTPSRRRLQRSLVRISSATPLELVPVDASVAALTADLSVSPAPHQDQESQNHVADSPSTRDSTTSKAEGPVMRRTNSDSGSGPVGAAGGPGLSASNSFPSLSDTVLRQIGALMEEVRQKDVHKEEDNSSEKDIESQFTSLMLAFKTDKLTLLRRLEQQQRQRDQAEANMAAELERLKAAVQLLSPLCTDAEKIELLEKVGEQVDALHKSTTWVSTSAEMYGAVQQENRLSRAVDIVLRHVENLKQAYDKEKTEHEETRKILTDNKLSPTAVLKLQNSKRRASIATVTRALLTPDPNRSPILPGENRSLSRVRLGSLTRKSSNTILESEPEEPQPTKDVVQTSPGPSLGQPRESSENVTSLAQAPTRSQPRKPVVVVEEGRLSSAGETESDDEPSTPEPVTNSEPSPPPTHLYQRKMSIQATWVSQLQECAQWVGSVDQLLLHLRCCIAVLLLLAAVAVFTSCCVLPYTHLGS